MISIFKIEQSWKFVFKTCHWYFGLLFLAPQVLTNGGATSISYGIFSSKLAWHKRELRNMSLFQLKLEYLCFNPRLSFIVSLDFSLKFKFSFSECGTGATEIFGGLKADRQDLCGAIN